MKKKHLIILIVFLGLAMVIRMIMIGIICLLLFSSEFEINEDINKYNDYIGEKAKGIYKIKWGMDETIFPREIKNISDVVDYKMVYYNPWDAEYLSYLVMDYNSDDYREEVERLRNYPSTKYKGYYGVKGFDKYDLLAMYADSYNGFVYAITDGESKIIYVELIFCDYQYDIKYKKYIDEDYLPVGFDATDNNKYLRQEMKKR